MADPSTPLLSVRDVTVRFGGIVALDGVSFDVPAGHVCGLIGPNGAGKTTLFNCLSRLYAYQSGDILFEGQSITALPTHRIAALGMGRTFQNLAMFRRLPVRDNIMVGAHEYEALLAAHAPLARLEGPADEWDAIAVSYTSGTTGDPKGVVTHHRGAYLNAVCNAATWTMPSFPKYLWTLPMFHCNGWCFPWTVALQGGTHVCLRRVEAKAILDAIRSEGVDHYCAAPIVHSLIYNAPEAMRAGITQKVRGMVAGAAPPAAMIEGMAKIGFDITHVYGLTEVYGPAGVAVKRPGWADASLSEQTRLNGRQGVRYPLQEGMAVLDPETLAEVPTDGQTMGEIMFRGNIVMKGYLKNPTATAKSFEGGWFHTGDLAVLEADRYAKIRDRSKDVIISGGENISSIEVEDALYRHAAVMACAVVARPDPKWGETPVAYVELKEGARVDAAELVAHCKGLLAGYKVPREIRFEPIPKTSTGKIQKFQLRARAKSASAIE